MEVLKFRKQAYASSTKTTYKSQLRAYLIFCAYYGYQPLPASTITLSRYAAFLARSLSISSIPAYLNIVRILHLEHGLEDPTKNNFHLATTLRGIRRCKGQTVSQKKPMTPDMLLAIKEHLNLTDPAHANFWAVCLVGFFGLLRKANMLLKGVCVLPGLGHHYQPLVQNHSVQPTTPHHPTPSHPRSPIVSLCSTTDCLQAGSSPSVWSCLCLTSTLKQ